MSSYTPPAPLSPLTKARSVDINNLTSSVATAFAALPTDADLNNGTVNFGVDSGTANTYIVTLPRTPTGYVDGLRVVFSPLNSNTGASTINVNGLGVKNIRLQDNTAAEPGTLVAGIPKTLIYGAALGNFFVEANSVTSAAASAAAAAASAGQAASFSATAQLSATNANNSALAASGSASNAAISASSAQSSAAAAAISATSLTANSTTSIAAGTGDKVFVIDIGKQFPDGEVVTITSKGAPGVRMFGVVKSYAGPNLTVTVDGVEGVGTRSDWVIAPGGQRGQQGIQGLTGGVNGGTLLGLLAELKSANIAAAATTNVWAAVGNSATLTGTTAITSFGTAPQAGAKFTLIAGAATPLTNSGSLVLPGGVDYTTTVGDRVEIYAETATKMNVSIFKADGTAVIGGVTYVARTANATLTRSDTGKFIDITSGTFAQTFDNLANLPSGWAVWIRNSGSGDITIPASDGVTNWIMYTGETRLFMKDQATGTLKSAVLVGFDRAFTSSVTFVKPPGYSHFEGELWDGGAGGSGGGVGMGGAGGRGGEWASFDIPASLVGGTESVVVGAGGSPGGGGAGPGGFSSFGLLVSAVSGQGSFVAGGSGGPGGAVGDGTGGGGFGAGKGGGGGGGGGTTVPGNAFGSNGGVGGGSRLAGRGGDGGESSAIPAVPGSAGNPGAAPGGGGGGGGGAIAGGSGGPGGPGARGEVRIRGVA